MGGVGLHGQPMQPNVGLPVILTLWCPEWLRSRQPAQVYSAQHQRLSRSRGPAVYHYMQCICPLKPFSLGQIPLLPGYATWIACSCFCKRKGSDDAEAGMQHPHTSLTCRSPADA